MIFTQVQAAIIGVIMILLQQLDYIYPNLGGYNWFTNDTLTKKQTTRCYIMRKSCAKHHQEENSYRGEARVAIFIPSDAAHTIFS